MKPIYFGINLYACSKVKSGTYLIRIYSNRRVPILYYIQFAPYAKTYCYSRREYLCATIQERIQKIFKEMNGETPQFRR